MPASCKPSFRHVITMQHAARCQLLRQPAHHIVERISVSALLWRPDPSDLEERRTEWRGWLVHIAAARPEERLWD